MKKKVIILVIIIFALILLVPIPLHLKDGGSIKYKALLYSVTKYHQLDHESKTGYRDGIKIEILGMQIYKKLDNSNNETGGLAPTISKEKIYIAIDNILNINLLDDFMDNANNCNKNPISQKVEIVTYTKEGDEILTTLEYNKEINEFVLTHDNTKDKFASVENRKITTNTYSRSSYDLVKEFNNTDIYVKLKSNNNENEDVYICSYNKNLEKSKDTTRVTLKEAKLKSKDASTTELISYNGIVYGKSYATIDYQANYVAPIAAINKLIGEEYMPILNGETNTESLLNSIIVEVHENRLVLFHNSYYYVLFNKIETNLSSFFAKVIESKASYIIVEPLEGSNERKSADKISIGLGKYNDCLYEVGTTVKITYDGTIMESYPAKINAINIEVKSADDFEILFYDKQPQSNIKIHKIVDKNEIAKYNYDVFVYGGSVNIRIKGKDYSLKEALIQNKITMEEIIAKANQDEKAGKIKAEMYRDGGSMEYHYDNYTIIKFHTENGNRDVYIGSTEMTINSIIQDTQMTNMEFVQM